MERRRSGRLRPHRLTIAIAIALAAALPLAAQTAPTGTLERVRESGRITLGYRADAKPFAWRNEAGNADGYSIALCQQVADAVKRELRVSTLKVEWVPVAAQNRFDALQKGSIDILCGSDTVTLRRRSQVAFSIPIFPGGIGALLRSDAPLRLRQVLSGKGQAVHPTWRASASQLLEAKDFAAVEGTTAQKWLVDRINDLQILTKPTPVASYDAGVDAVLARRVDALFGERAILLDRARRSNGDLIVVDRLFTYEPLAFAVRLNDEPFRLLVDRTLTQFYASGQFGAHYAKWFGEPDESAINFFRWSVVPD